MQETITRQEVLNAINRGEVFDIEYVTCDKKRGTGGKIVALSRATKFVKQILPAVKRERFEAQLKSLASHNKKYHSTINVYQTDKREVRTIHIRLIIFFNGKRVI